MLNGGKYKQVKYNVNFFFSYIAMRSTVSSPLKRYQLLSLLLTFDNDTAIQECADMLVDMKHTLMTLNGENILYLINC